MEIQRIQSRHVSADHLDGRMLVQHWEETVRRFNDVFARARIPIRLKSEHLHSQPQIDRLIDLNECVSDFLKARMQGQTISGMMYDTQIETVAEVFRNIYEDPKKCVLVLGAMMCGKTGTANATHLIGPIFYLLSGIKYYPVQLLPPRKAISRQTEHELEMWDSLYQDLTVCRLDKRGRVEAEISVRTYRARHIRGRLHEHVRAVVRRPLREIFSYLRAARSASKVSPVQHLCRAAQQDGFSIVMIVDEPHWGSHQEGVQARMLAQLEEEQARILMEEEMQSVSKDHMLITFDATPFQISNADRFSVVRHRLGANYCGPNCWGGLPLDPTVRTRDINLRTFDDFALECGVPDLAKINRGALTSASAYQKWLALWNKRHPREPLKWSHATYQGKVIAALRETLQNILLRPQEPRTRGVCLRILKTNTAAADLIRKLNLGKIKVICYMANVGQETIAEAIDAEAPTGPYVVLVTGAARMADFFPQHCTHFIDFTETITSQPALMQGTYGRACGYGEPRWVIMNERSIHYIRNYVESNGKYMLSPGPQSSVPSTNRKGRPYMNIRINFAQTSADPVISEAFGQVQTIVDKMAFTGNMMADRREITALYEDGYVPFWGIFTESVLAHIEQAAPTLLPDCAEAPTILRPGASQRSVSGMILEVAVDKSRPSYGKVGFRNKQYFKDQPHTSANMQVKGKYMKTDNTARGEIAGGVQPQLWCLPDERARKWRLDDIVLRLSRPVRGRRLEPDLIYAASSDFYYKFHSEDQQIAVLEREGEPSPLLRAGRRHT